MRGLHAPPRVGGPLTRSQDFNIVSSSFFFLTSLAFRMPKLVHVHGNIFVWILLDNLARFVAVCKKFSK